MRPKDEATALKVVWVVESDGTYMVRVVPDLLVTKEEQLDTDEEPI